MNPSGWPCTGDWKQAYRSQQVCPSALALNRRFGTASLSGLPSEDAARQDGAVHAGKCVACVWSGTLLSLQLRMNILVTDCYNNTYLYSLTPSNS